MQSNLDVNFSWEIVTSQLVFDYLETRASIREDPQNVSVFNQYIDQLPPVLA